MSQQSETELDRLWSALDKTNLALDAIEQRLARELPQPRPQAAPTPDYRMAEFDGKTEPGVALPCSCDEALELRACLLVAIDLLSNTSGPNWSSRRWAFLAEREAAQPVPTEQLKALCDAFRNGNASPEMIARGAFELGRKTTPTPEIRPGCTGPDYYDPGKGIDRGPLGDHG